MVVSYTYECIYIWGFLVVCMCVLYSALEYSFMQRSEKSIGLLDAGITGCCESPKVGSGNHFKSLERALNAPNC